MAEINIYTTPNCIYCRMAKEFLNENKLKFKEIDVSSSEEAAKEMVEKSEQRGVPVIEIDGKIIVGFDEPKLRKLLKIK